MDASKNDLRLRFREFHPTGFDEQLERCAEAMPNVILTVCGMPLDLVPLDIETYMNIHLLAVCEAAGNDWAHLDGLDPYMIESELPRQIIRRSKNFRYFVPTDVESHTRINALGHNRMAYSLMKPDVRLQMAFRVYIMAFALWHGASEDDLRFIKHRFEDLRWAAVIRGDVRTAIEELL